MSAVTLLDRWEKELFGGRRRVPVEWRGAGFLDSGFPVNSLASASVALAGVALREFSRDVAAFRETRATTPAVTVDHGLVSAWFSGMFTPVRWGIPSPWDPLSGDYRASDGWVRLHTNAPHHRARALEVLGSAPEREAVEAAVARWSAAELEAAVVAAGGCAARLQTEDEWFASEPGSALADEPLINSAMLASSAIEQGIAELEPALPANSGAPGRFAPTGEPPLRGIRVLDLTRVLAGPVATRFLAGFGAEVLRIDPPDWDEPAVVPEMTLGKRAARLDLRTPTGRATFEDLVSTSDIVVHGYRADALDKLGFDDETLHALRPGLVTVALNAYGWRGPWVNRRGFDSLVQMSTGIAHAGSAKPTPLPVQALDHATGYLAAAAAIEGLRQQVLFGSGSASYVSLARTARELVLARREGMRDEAGVRGEFESSGIRTPWGKARLLPSPVTVGGATMQWSEAPRALGTDEPRWR